MAERASQKRNKKKGAKKGKLIILVIELIVIVAMFFVAYQVFKITKPKTGPTTIELDKTQLEIPEEVKENVVMKGYRNIALFGVDATTDAQLYTGSNSDSIMIASINMDTGAIKLVSVYRDTFLNIDDTNTFTKCNAAYARGTVNGMKLKGGANPAIKMLNKNLDLDIEDFVTVGYKGLRELVDGLGGIYIDIDEVELGHINNYQITIAEKVLKCVYTPVTETGYQKLDGLQAAAYCRIRYGGGDDFKRASRQREVLKAIEEQAKKADLNTLTKIFNDVIDDVYTSIDKEDILDLIKNISKYHISEEGGFPNENMRTTGNIGAKGSCVIPVNLESNVVWLHQFLFEDQEYTVTDRVKEYSKHIEEETYEYLHKKQ